MVDQLTGGERRRHEFHAIDHRVEPAFEQLDQVVASVAAAAHRFIVKPAKLALADIGVIALQLLFRGKLSSKVGRLFAPLAVLARTVFAAVERALRPTPQIHLEAAVDLVFRFLSLAAHTLEVRFGGPGL